LAIVIDFAAVWSVRQFVRQSGTLCYGQWNASDTDNRVWSQTNNFVLQGPGSHTKRRNLEGQNLHCKLCKTLIEIAQWLL